MTRRFEAGPVLVIIGAIVLLVSLFIDWFSPGVTAWTVFEVLDLLLAALALGAILAAFGMIMPETALLERRWLPPLVVVTIVVIASQIIDPPPAVSDGDVDDGAWLALGASAAMLLGAVLIFSRVHLAVTIEGRDTRRRVAAVDARDDGEAEATPAVEDTAPDPLATQPLPPTDRPESESESELEPEPEPKREERALWERLGGPEPAGDREPTGDEPRRD
jgi:hypothetical protein